MAPVGSRESLAAAIHAGAQSVYFGIGQLNMRAHSASTFGIDDLKDIAAQCHAHGLNSYLTVNTVIYDDDLAAMRRIIDAAKAAGIRSAFGKRQPLLKAVGTGAENVPRRRPLLADV